MATPIIVGYNPIEVSKTIEKAIVIEIDGEVARKYYRFAPTKFYGGSATGYATGCNLRCIYCWSWEANTKAIGEYYKPGYVAKKLIGIANEKSYKFVRLSGGEPTLAVNHLFQLLDYLSMDAENRGKIFILETNGILIGYDKQIARNLYEYKFVVVRLSLKGCSEEEFHFITGADKTFFNMQLQAVKNLLDNDVRTVISITISFCKKETLSRLLEKLAAIDNKLIDNIEIEYVKLYQNVLTRLCKRGLAPWIAIKPPNKIINQADFHELCRSKS